MIKEYKKVTKPSSIGSTYAPDLVNKLNDYCKLIGVDRTKIVSSLIAKALEGKILTNDFIKLDKPYYFDLKKLIHEGTAEATTEKPVIDPKRVFILKKVPNNLDVKNKEHGTYSFTEDKPSFHKGIYYCPVLDLEKYCPLLDLIKILKDFENLFEDLYVFYNSENFLEFYFLFEYEEESNKIIIHNIKKENLIYEVDPLIYHEVLKDIKQQIEDREKNLFLPDGNINLFYVLESDIKFREVMFNYKDHFNTDIFMVWTNLMNNLKLLNK